VGTIIKAFLGVKRELIRPKVVFPVPVGATMAKDSPRKNLLAQPICKDEGKIFKRFLKTFLKSSIFFSTSQKSFKSFKEFCE
jgi:hypothetical protein